MLAQDGEEDGEQHEDRAEEVEDEQEGVGVATRVVHDGGQVEVAEERAEEGDLRTARARARGRARG